MTGLPDQAGRPGTAGDLILLAIDTAGSACSAALARGGSVVAAESRQMRHGHGEALLPMIDRVTAAAGLPPARLDAVAAATGPGGFTGIRVGLAAAHGIALATGARLIGIASFVAVASLMGEAGGGACLVALDSRREDLYVQLFARSDGQPLAEPAAVLPAALADYLLAAKLPPNTPLLIAGDAAAAAAAALEAWNGVTVAPDSAPDALGVAVAALRVVREGAVIAPARPLYLRPPDVTLPRRAPVGAAMP
jgi:tRNA threonylcarbamoyladenosine biosynthesis protein TsaB